MLNEEKKARMKEEAVRRMKKMGIYGPTIEQFRKSGKISISEPPLGAFFWAEKELDEIRKFEEENGVLVFLVVRSFTEMGVMDSYLFVEKDESEWELSFADLNHYEPKYGWTLFAYVNVHGDPFCSEFGSICLKKTAAAGLLRTA